MKRVHTYHIWPRNLDFSAKAAVLKDFALQRGFVITDKSFQYCNVEFDRYASAKPDTFDEFANVLKKSPSFTSFHFQVRIKRENPSGYFFFEVGLSPSRIEVGIDGNDDDIVIAAHDHIRREWNLRNPPLPATEAGRPRVLQATIFLGKHFDETAKEPSMQLERFLNLLRFDVKLAEEYRGGPIPQKVQERIDEQDIYVGLVTGQREHDWLVAEAAYARGKKNHVIMIVEEGSKFNPTILGRDYEQITFPPGMVEKAFIKLLQEFRSLGIAGL